MDESLRSLLAQLEQIADQFRELRDGVQQVIKIAEASPEMALTRARKVLEYVIRDVYQRRVNEPPGTRPLENLLQRLVKDGFFPDRLDAYANTIRKLGNVGTHSFNEQVAIADVYQSLAQLMPILQWYFEVERPEALGGNAFQGQIHVPSGTFPSAQPGSQEIDEAKKRLPQPRTNRVLVAGRSPVMRLQARSRETAQGDGQIFVVLKGLRSFDAHDADFFLDLLPGPRDKGRHARRNSLLEKPDRERSGDRVHCRRDVWAERLRQIVVGEGGLVAAFEFPRRAGLHRRPKRH